ncbi:hypothetical protein [Xanthobacter autotrophicus]|uniref:hypothetical protein n=1 Tax=Xanthobacter autotrophicus TaxID=280 RepID=UPI00372A8E4B
MPSPNTRPMHVRPVSTPVVLRSMGEAVDFLRALPIAEHAGMLIEVIEAADAPELERRARLAFETFAAAMRIPVRLAS